MRLRTLSDADGSDGVLSTVTQEATSELDADITTEGGSKTKLIALGVGGAGLCLCLCLCVVIIVIVAAAEGSKDSGEESTRGEDSSKPAKDAMWVFSVLLIVFVILVILAIIGGAVLIRFKFRAPCKAFLIKTKLTPNEKLDRYYQGWLHIASDASKTRMRRDVVHLYHGEKNLKFQFELKLKFELIPQAELTASSTGHRRAYHPALMEDKEFVTELVGIWGNVLQYATPALKGDKEVVLVAVAEDTGSHLGREQQKPLSYAAPALQADKEIVLVAVALFGTDLQYAVALQADKDVVSVAVAQNGMALEHADPVVKADATVVLVAVAQNGLALNFADPALKADETVATAAVAQNGMALEFAIKPVKDVVLVAVAQNGLALHYAAPRLQADADVVLEAVKQDGRALEYAASAMQGDKTIATAAVTQSFRALHFVSPALQFDRDLLDIARPQLIKAVQRAPLTELKRATPAMQDDYEVVSAAVRANTYSSLRPALQYASTRSVAHFFCLLLFVLFAHKIVFLSSQAAMRPEVERRPRDDH